jgi:hypothetical protein
MFVLLQFTEWTLIHGLDNLGFSKFSQSPKGTSMQCNANSFIKNGINTFKYLTITITSNASQMIGFLQKKFTSRKTKELQFAVVRSLEYCPSAWDPGNKNHKTKKSKRRAGLVPFYYIIHEWICSKILCYVLYYTMSFVAA